MKKAIHAKIKPSLEQFCSEKKRELWAAAKALQMDVTFKYAGRILSLDEVLEDLYCHGGSPKTQLELQEFVLRFIESAFTFMEVHEDDFEFDLASSVGGK